MSASLQSRRGADGPHARRDCDPWRPSAVRRGLAQITHRATSSWSCGWGFMAERDGATGVNVDNVRGPFSMTNVGLAGVALLAVPPEALTCTRSPLSVATNPLKVGRSPRRRGVFQEWPESHRHDGRVLGRGSGRAQAGGHTGGGCRVAIRALVPASTRQPGQRRHYQHSGAGSRNAPCPPFAVHDRLSLSAGLRGCCRRPSPSPRTRRGTASPRWRRRDVIGRANGAGIALRT